MFICLEVKNKHVIQQTITMRLDKSVVDAPIMAVVRVINELIGGQRGLGFYSPAHRSDGVDEFICDWLCQFDSPDGYKIIERRQAIEQDGCGRRYVIPSKVALSEVEQLRDSLRAMNETLATEANEYENFKEITNDKLEKIQNDICNIKMMD